MHLRHASSNRFHYVAVFVSGATLGSVVYTITQTSKYGEVIKSLLSDDDQSNAMQQYVKWLALGSTATTVGTLVSAGLMAVKNKIQKSAKVRVAGMVSMILGLNVALIVAITRMSQHFPTIAVLLLLAMYFQTCIWVFAVVPTAQVMSEEF